MKKKEELLQEKKSCREGCLRAGVTSAVIALLWAVAWVLVLLLTGCKGATEYVTVEKVVERTDTVREVQLLRDTAHVRDSVFLTQYLRGDTMYVVKYKERVEYRERVKRDTVYKSKRDSVAVPVPYPVEFVKEVEKPLKWWQKWLMWIGAFAVLVVAGALVLKWKKVF